MIMNIKDNQIDKRKNAQERKYHFEDSMKDKNYTLPPFTTDNKI